MDLRVAPAQPAAPAASWGQRLIGRWWRRQTPARQDRFATLAPLVSVLLFLAAIVSAFWTLRNEEFEREAESVKRDAEIAQRQIQLHLIENHEQLVQLARQIVTKEIDADEAQRLARTFGASHPEVMQLTWLDALRRRRAGYASPLTDADTHPLGINEDRMASSQARSREAEWAFIAARDLRQPVYSRPFKDGMGTAVFQTHVPLLNGGVFAGALIVEYSIENLLRYFVPPEVARRRAISVLDENGRTLASTVMALPGRANPQAPILHDVPLAPSANGVVLRAAGYRTSALLIGNTLFWMVLALSGLTLWMLLGTWRHMRRRAQIQGALVQETNFRRAMENSMLTGMRAMDLEGRITYVNPAFCAMTGYSEP
jgi:PAS domain-containing protein